MSLNIEVIPTLYNNNGVPITKLLITIDCTTIKHFFEEYNLLIKTYIYVATPSITNETVTIEAYDYAQIYSKCDEENQVQFEAMVYGLITDSEMITCKAQGSLVEKRVRDNE